MRLKCIGCEVFARALYQCAAQSPHSVDIELLRYGLHRTTNELRVQLQQRIDAAASEPYDAVVLAYGLCGKATAGLIARAHPLVVPRAHDCITLFLGSRAKYQDEFENRPGTYWYAQDYVERSDGSKSTLAMGSGSEIDLDGVYDEYVKKYGKDNADYLMQVMGAWRSHYKRAALIDLGVGDVTRVEAKAQADAARRGWTFERVAGDLVLLRRLLAGDWVDDFLVLEPASRIEMTCDDQIIREEK